MKKRIISMLLVIVMVVGMLPTTVHAQEDVELDLGQMHHGDKGGDTWIITDANARRDQWEFFWDYARNGKEELYLDCSRNYRLRNGDSLTYFLEGPMTVVVGPGSVFSVEDIVPEGHPIELQSAILCGGDIYSKVTARACSCIDGGNFYASVKINGNSSSKNGNFYAEVTNEGTIYDGTFYAKVGNYGTIYDGTFESTVVVGKYKQIRGGTFNGKVENSGTIYNNGNIKLGPDFILTGSGRVVCNAHIMQDGV